MKERKTPAKSQPSAVIQWFQSPIPPRGANYARGGVPAEWRPRIVYAEPIYDVEYDKHFTAHITLRLEKFDFSAQSRGSVESAKAIGKRLIGWMAGIPGVRIRDCAQGWSWEDAGHSSGVGHWLFRYDIGVSRGVFNVWIVPVTAGSATMIASLDERVGARR